MRNAWLTPDAALLLESQDCRTIRLPGSLWYLVSGAILELTRQERWEQDGDATPEEMSQFFLGMWEEFTMSRCSYIGELRAFAFGTMPNGWLAMDGGSHDVAAYPNLAAIIPSSWLSGSEFTLPDLAGTNLVGAGVAGFGIIDVGDQGGSHEHTLTESEMPAHTHSFEVAITAPDILGELPGVAMNALSPSVTGSTGSGQAHNNMPPYLVVAWGIYTGVY